jgi:hypothetical protein
MRGTVRLLMLALAVALLPSLAAQTAGNVKMDEAQIRAKLLAGRFFDARVVDIGKKSDEPTVTVRYSYIVKKQPDPIAVKKAEILQKIYEKAVESKIDELISKIGAELEKAQKEAADFDETPVHFVLRLDAGAKLRNMQLPLDDNGKPKKLTLEEQKELKGDPSLPGYVATIEDLSLDQQVRVHVDKGKYRPASGKAKDKDNDARTVYPITMLVILAPPALKANENPFVKQPDKGQPTPPNPFIKQPTKK